MKIEQCRQEKFSIKSLPEDERPYREFPRISLEDIKPVDENGVIVYEQDGQKYFHPVLICETIFSLLNSYRQNKEKVYLAKAEQFAESLIQNSEKFDQALLLPYHFDFYLHDFKKPTDHMTSPWYSAMAQGEALSVFCWLYNLTKKDEYKKTADKIFQGILRLKGEHKPWVSLVDQEGFLWLEEYPLEEPELALNGFIFAIFGVYEYFLTTDNEKAKAVLVAALTTVKAKISLFRNQGDYSSYCLKHQKKSKFYHLVHIRQLKMLYQITNDHSFQEAARLFQKDGRNLVTKVKKAFKIISARLGLKDV